MALKRPRAFTISSSPEDFYTLKSNRSIRHPSPVVLIPKPTPERKTKERPRRTTKASAPLQKEQRVPAPIEGTPIPAKGNSKSTAPPWKKRRIVAPIKSTPTPARRKPRVSASFEVQEKTPSQPGKCSHCLQPLPPPTRPQHTTHIPAWKRLGLVLRLAATTYRTIHTSANNGSDERESEATPSHPPQNQDNTTHHDFMVLDSQGTDSEELPDVLLISSSPAVPEPVVSNRASGHIDKEMKSNASSDSATTIPPTRLRRRGARVSYVAEPISDISDDEVIDADLSDQYLSADSDSDAESELTEPLLSATSSRSASPNHYSESESDVVLGDIQEIIPKKKPTKTAKTSSKRKIDRSINADLPPMDNMEDIFTDMANNILELGLGPILQERNGRPYRVGTMCSGTESPICALEALSSSLQQRGMPPISIDHVFSAENELFKQGFIEVNYHPKIMFRDVREFLPEDATKAITAYGAEEDIPGNLDFLVAGFVCKNISTMNNHKKSLDEDGETGETWRSVLAYTTRFRPRIVLLENVTGKKEYWDDYIKAKLEAIDYACAWNIYDTKNYYIPQTRQRMYMIAIDKRQHGKHANQAANIWKDTMGKLQRQCSSPFGAFLTADYPDQYDYRSSPSSSNSDWALCRLRYAEIRSEERLGIRRPITRWSENGTVRPPDFADRDWYNTQRARVYDCIDISSLQAAQKGYDAMYKMMVWNVSQNVDRYKGSNDASFGLVSCITPTGIDFVSNRHTVLTGSQLLLLQGMPTDKLIFTSQSQKERQDLAGNAMTTTVIGASLLSALLAGGPGNMESPSRQESPQPDPEPERTRLPVSVVKYKIAPPKQLLDLKQLLVDAQMSSILCNCEGTRKTSKAPIKVCAQCAHTACATCAGNPTHSYDSTIPPSNRIQTPGDFERKWRPHLPPRLVFEKFPDIQNLIHNITDSAQLQDMDMAAQQFCIGDFKRQDNLWKVCYHSEQARLDLLLADTVEWRLYVNCPRSEPGSSLLRQNLSKPLARGLINDSLLAPRWTVHIPEPQTYNITITASQQRTGSWRNRMGLPDHKNETIPIHLDVDSDCVEDPSLAGSYTLLPHCGTAMESLYIMQKVDQPSLYLFLDPDQIGSTENDAFVFSHDCRRLPYGETRLKFATLNASWRPYDAKSEHAQKVETKVSGVWTFKENKNIKLKLAMPVLDVSIPSASALTSIKGQHCAQTIWILNVTVREAINLQSFSQYSWALEGAKRHKALEEFASWQTFSSKFANDCNCSPAFPPILWEMNNAKEVTPREDRKAAAAFERALKTRRPIITACTSSSASTSNVHIDIDVASLVHRANSLLATPHRDFWRLIVDHFDPPPEPFPRFGLQNNSSDEPYAGPLKIQYTLGKAQQKSLAWMKTQEEGVPLKLAEVVEEIHPELGWRVEAKAESTVIVRGGVLADLPSFGKTVTTISLINSEFEEFEPEEIVSKNRGENEASLIDIAATLIVCPAHIAVQWESEFKDCLGSDMFEDYGVLLIKRFSDLQRLNIDDFKKSRAIIVAKNVLAEKEYLNQLGQFAAMPAPASYRGRQFDVWMDYVSANMPQRVHEYENLDPAAFDEATQELFEERISSAQFNMMVPVAPKHGSAYLPWSKTQARNEKISQAKSKLPATRKRAATSVPLLQFFNWNRVVTDEYHYLLDGSLENHPACAAIKRLSASKRWILSGTPALTNFTDISQLGSFLGVTLGRDVYGDTFTTTEVEKRLIKEQTDVERFRSQTEVRSYHWYQARHSQAQSFVDSFVRQNEPELKDIPVSETLEAIQLGAGHHAVYLELSQRLISSGMQNNKSSGDWYNAILNDSTSADRSLIKSALEFKTEEGVKGLDGLITQRRNQRIDTETEFKNSAHKLKEECLAHLGDLEEDYYLKYKQEVGSSNVLGDEDTTQRVCKLFRKVELKEAGKRTSKKTILAAKRTTLKELASKLRDIGQELTKRVRAERLVDTISGLLPTVLAAGEGQQQHLCSSPSCAGTANSDQLFLICQCGHTACSTCLEQRVDFEACVHTGCGLPIDPTSLVKVLELGSTKDDGEEMSFGRKLDELASVIGKLPKNDQAIIFVPNSEVVSVIEGLLRFHQIPFHSLGKTNSSDTLEDFKTSKKKKVLVLNLQSESAAGANLVNANHVMFISPLLTESQYVYESAMAQAVARCRRYKQKKRVHIYHFAALQTIDVDILEQRHRRVDAIYSPGSTPPEETPELKEKKESTRLVRMKDESLALVPVSWLDDEDFVEGVEVDESFGSLIKVPY